MTTPKWLADEIEEFARRVKRGELEREEAVETLRDDARKKDDDWVNGVITATLSGKLDTAMSKIKKADQRRIERDIDRVATGNATFDDICSDYWPRESYGALTPTDELMRYAEDMLQLSERHMTRSQERHTRALELVATGEKTWEAAERKRLGIDGQDGQAVTG